MSEKRLKELWFKELSPAINRVSGMLMLHPDKTFDEDRFKQCSELVVWSYRILMDTKLRSICIKSKKRNKRNMLKPLFEEHVNKIQAIVESKKLVAKIHVGRTYEIMSTSRLCISVSGTATLETAYYRTPMVVVYRTTVLARHVVPHLIQVPYICLVNIVAGREAVPEFLLYDNNPKPVADAALHLLADESALQACRDELERVMQALGPTGSTRRAVDAVLSCISE